MFSWDSLGLLVSSCTTLQHFGANVKLDGRLLTSWYFVPSDRLAYGTTPNATSTNPTLSPDVVVDDDEFAVDDDAVGVGESGAVEEAGL
jgi:hypothetical protein